MTPEARGFGVVQAADDRRSGDRSQRFAESNPTVPSLEIWFMVVLIAIALAGLAYSVPRAKNRTELTALAVVTIAFIAAMGLFYTLDRPFGGAIALKPKEM